MLSQFKIVEKYINMLLLLNIRQKGNILIIFVFNSNKNILFKTHLLLQMFLFSEITQIDREVNKMIMKSRLYTLTVNKSISGSFN